MVARLTNIPSKQELRKLYVDDRMSCAAIGRLKNVCSAVGGCTPGAIYGFLDKHGLPTAKAQSHTTARNNESRHQAKSKCQEPTEYSDSP